MLEDLETDMDNNMVDMTNFFDRPQNDKRSPRPKQIENNSENCPTPQNGPTHLPKSSVLTTSISPTKPHRNEIWGVLPDKRRVPSVGQLVLEGSHPGKLLEIMIYM